MKKMYFPSNVKEMKDDEIVEFIKNNKETILDRLTPYERERINEEL